MNVPINTKPNPHIYFSRIGIEVSPGFVPSHRKLWEIFSRVLMFDAWLALIIWGAAEGWKYVGR